MLLSQKYQSPSTLIGGIFHVNDSAQWFQDEVAQSQIRDKNFRVARKTILVEVTPEVASEILTHNNRNRPKKHTQIDNLAELMSMGEFRDGVNSIAIDTNGDLQDGQHRLEAVVQSGVNVIMSVCFGAHPDDFAVTDIGTKRSGGDALRVAKLSGPNANYVCAALKALVEINTSRRRSISPSEVLELYKLHPLMEDCVGPGKRMKKYIPGNCSPAGASAAYYKILTESKSLKNNPAALISFWDQLVTGQGPSFGISNNKYDPIVRARSYFTNKLPKMLINHNGGLHSTEVIPRTALVVLTAWNLYTGLKSTKGTTGREPAYEWGWERNSTGEIVIY